MLPKGAFGIALLILLVIVSAAFGQEGGATPTPRPALFPTNTPRPTRTPTAATESLPQAGTTVTVIVAVANVRVEPNTDAAILVEARGGSSFPVVGQRMVGVDRWFQVTLPDGATGWLHAGVARLSVNWRRVVETFDGVEMVLVPAGCFLMGSADGETDERPVHVQCFDAPFWIDRYEVSNRRFGSAGYFSGDVLPRESVSWFAAAEHCAARGARLPTEAEWEYAARGPFSWVYPWGDTFVNENVVSSWQTTARQTEAVGSRPGGVSWVGAFNLSGNVWEWTSSLYRPYPYDPTDGREDQSDTFSPRVARGGGCCSYIIADVRAAYRFPLDPYTEDPNVGFRCARAYFPVP